MDADKWSRYYERTKEKEGRVTACKELVKGMTRELKSRMDRAGPLGDPVEIANEVDTMYREVASRHRGLREDGYVDLIEETAPKEISQLFKMNVRS